jgi:hypothetical protein
VLDFTSVFGQKRGKRTDITVFFPLFYLKKEAKYNIRNVVVHSFLIKTINKVQKNNSVYYRLTVFENRMLRRLFRSKTEGVADGWKKINSKESQKPALGVSSVQVSVQSVCFCCHRKQLLTGTQQTDGEAHEGKCQKCVLGLTT